MPADGVSEDVRLVLDAVGADSLQDLRLSLRAAHAVLSRALPAARPVPRRAARRLLVAYEKFEEEALEPNVVALDASGRDELRRVFLEESPLVARGAETVEQKGRRYLAEGRLTIQRLRDDGLVVASCSGSAGELYRLGFDPRRREWRCTCPTPGRAARCSHVAALRIVLGR